MNNRKRVRPSTGELRGMVEAWLKKRMRSVYDLHAWAYLLLGWTAFWSTDPYVVRAAVGGIILGMVIATAHDTVLKLRTYGGGGEH